MNHVYSGKIGIRFPKAEGVRHDEHLPEQRRLNRISKRDRKRLERAQKNRVWKAAKALAFRLIGEDATGPFEAVMLAACAAHVILNELIAYEGMAEHMIYADRDTGYMGGDEHVNQSRTIRQVPPLDQRESCDQYIRKGTHGASKDAPRVMPYSRDGFL